jgi:hypothetical protein
MGMARDFLDGVDNGPIEYLKSEMELASSEMLYERAAAMRDKAKRLEQLRQQFNRLHFAVESLSFVYNVPGYEGDDRVYLIRRGRVRAEVTAPRTPTDAAAMLQLIDSVYTPVEREARNVDHAFGSDQAFVAVADIVVIQNVFVGNTLSGFVDQRPLRIEARRTIDSVYTPVERETSRIPTHEIDELLLLSSWFKRFPNELTHTSGGRQLTLPVAS